MMEKIWKKLQQGLIDYCQKYRFQQVILGLSGGLDSAITAVLAADALGGQNVTALMMKTRYTSDLSLNIAKRIAELNHLHFQELDIEPLVQAHTNFLKNAFHENVNGLTLENLQARIRGQILMAYSNQQGGLVLACGNKSEALTGYCTLYGDTCGGLMPIGNLYKSTIFDLAKWRNKQNIVLPEEVISRAPSAELAEGQKDENTLPPYGVLDTILKLMVDEYKSAEEICHQGFDLSLVQRVQKLVCNSSFKRKQMAEILPL